ncbi:MAG: hypothetical protein L0Y66_03080 [Myxococcaceae bacterium]|nr:hypothetical protein [Myxococcaceae bacterium]MCI0672638.1 hypothetical protein [Myxococcaceae bacterium]
MLSLLVAVVTAGCTHHLEPTLKVELTNIQPRALDVALVIPQELRTRTDTYGSFATLGFGNTWVCSTGVGLVPALERMAKSTFKHVRIVSSAQEAGDADLRLEPTVAELRQMPERSGFWISFKLRAVAQDGVGVPWLDKTYEEVEEGSTAAAVWGGSFAAAAALLTPTERAMERALMKLSVDLQRIDKPAGPQS